ncbi:MAG: ABC transporter permease [Solirubrobacterales bacterium]
MSATPTTPAIGRASVARRKATTRRSPAGASATRSIALIAVRNAKKVGRVPAILATVVIYPLMMILLMSQVFRGFADIPGFPVGVDYIDYLTPALLALGVMTNASNSATGIASDLSSGMLDRLRAMPVRGWTVLAGRSASDVIVSVGQVAFVAAIAVVILGFSPSGSPLEVAAAFGLILYLGLAFSGVFMILGTLTRNAEAADMASSTLIIPLMFLSSVFVPTETMPGWIAAVADVNPLSLVADASRGLFFGAADAGDILTAVVGTTIVLVVSMAVASRAYQRASS